MDGDKDINMPGFEIKCLIILIINININIMILWIVQPFEFTFMTKQKGCPHPVCLEGSAEDHVAPSEFGNFLDIQEKGHIVLEFYKLSKIWFENKIDKRTG